MLAAECFKVCWSDKLQTFCILFPDIRWQKHKINCLWRQSSNQNHWRSSCNIDYSMISLRVLTFFFFSKLHVLTFSTWKVRSIISDNVIVCICHEEPSSILEIHWVHKTCRLVRSSYLLYLIEADHHWALDFCCSYFTDARFKVVWIKRN